MVDLLKLSISQWLLVSWWRGIGIDLDVDIEDVALQALGRAEGSEKKSGLEMLRGSKELDWEVFLSLYSY